MNAAMKEDKPKALVSELARDIKSRKNLGARAQQLVKLTVEAALNAELDEHLGYEKHDPAGRGSANSRNGPSAKRERPARRSRNRQARQELEHFAGTRDAQYPKIVQFRRSHRDNLICSSSDLTGHTASDQVQPNTLL